MKIEKMMENKTVLMIPVYSTRSYDDNCYNLLADGNMSKYLMKILNCKAKEIDIFYPFNSTGIITIQKIINNNCNNKVNCMPVKYGINAHETRNMGETFLEYILQTSKKYDLIIFEIDTLPHNYKRLFSRGYTLDNLLYWVGSWNADGTRWDELEHTKYNKQIAQEINTICIIPNQKNIYGGKTEYDECIYNPKYFEKKIIFFPFRLSDKSYKPDLFKEMINKLLLENCDNFVVIYTDPNDSHLFDDKNSEIYIKIPSNKYVYLSMLKSKPIIPYFDNPEVNYHSNIYEFIYYGCNVIMYNNNIFNGGVIKANDDIEFYNILKNEVTK